MRSAPLALSFMGALLLVAGLASAGVLTRGAEASHGGADAFSIDMNTAGNTATSLGTLDTCASASAGSTVTFDITVTNIPAFNDGGTPGVPADDSGGIMGWLITILYNETPLTVQSENQSFLVANTPGSTLSPLGSDPTPDTDGSNGYLTSTLDTSFTVPEEGSGVLTRLVIEVDPAAVTGLYDLQFDPADAVHTDSSNTAFAPHDLTSIGTIAVGQACPVAATPTATTAPAAAPTATGTATSEPDQLPPTGDSDDGSGAVSPLFLGAAAAALLLAALGYGGYAIRRRLRTRS